MLSLLELERIAGILQRQWSGARIQGVVQPDALNLVLTLYRGEGERIHLRLCCQPEFARASAAPRVPKALPAPPALTQYLRAHFGQARLVHASLRNRDRQLALEFEAAEASATLLLSILGPRSNVYLLDGEGRLVQSLRPLAKTRRNLRVGDVWTDPETRAPEAGVDRWPEEPDESYLACIENHYGERQAVRDVEAVARRLAQVLKKERDGLGRKEKKLEAESQAGAKAQEYQRQGELLKTAMKRVRPGMTEVVVRDPESDSDVAIELDAKLTPAANLERLFKRFRKGIKQATSAGQQLGELAERRGQLDALAAELEAMLAQPELDERALEAFSARADVARLLGKYAPPPPREPKAPTRKRLPGRLEPRRYRSGDGLEIWVGRSDEGNDYLTTRLARGRDLFFHLEGEPGSHVILRTEGKSDPPSESLIDACELAIHFSKQKKASRASVHVVPIKDVKKPKGAKPGLVYVYGGKTIHVRRDEARLRRVLESRIDA